MARYYLHKPELPWELQERPADALCFSANIDWRDWHAAHDHTLLMLDKIGVGERTNFRFHHDMPAVATARLGDKLLWKCGSGALDENATKVFFDDLDEMLRPLGYEVAHLMMGYGDCYMWTICPYDPGFVNPLDHGAILLKLLEELSVMKVDDDDDFVRAGMQEFRDAGVISDEVWSVWLRVTEQEDTL